MREREGSTTDIFSGPALLRCLFSSSLDFPNTFELRRFQVFESHTLVSMVTWKTAPRIDWEERHRPLQQEGLFHSLSS